MNFDEKIMLRCLELADNGAGYVSPNPLVGAVIVKDGAIIGEGWHKKIGKEHAEVEAIRSVQGSIKGGTMYVNLEPCSHSGRTPPCVDAIIQAGINRVIVGSPDPNPRAQGGIKILRDRGIEVISGVLLQQCKFLNEAFYKNILTGDPLVVAKIACSLDGRMSRDDKDNALKWITGEEARTEVHRLRSRFDGICVGVGTILADNPHLTVRGVVGKDPVRIILDSNLRSPLSANVFADNNVIIISGQNIDKDKILKFQDKGIKVVQLEFSPNGSLSLIQLQKYLISQNVFSLLLESGPILLDSFLKEKLVDKITLHIAPIVLGAGRCLPSIGASFTFSSTRLLGQDAELTGYFDKFSKLIDTVTY